MSVLLQIDFPSTGPWGPEMSEEYGELAASIADEPGLQWKIWTENETDGFAGGIYLFDTAATARAYLAKHTERLAGLGVTGIRALVFDVNEPLTATTRGPVSGA